MPTLGAFVLSKATTFASRPRDPGLETSAKRGKDLLYLRDLMSAGPEVVQTIHGDIDRICETDGDARRLRKRATRLLNSAIAGELVRDVAPAAEELAEREGRFTVESARSEIEGRLTDLRDTLSRRSGNTR